MDREGVSLGRLRVEVGEPRDGRDQTHVPGGNPSFRVNEQKGRAGGKGGGGGGGAGGGGEGNATPGGGVGFQDAGAVRDAPLPVGVVLTAKD